ncbi:recombinase [Trichococcus palustris]|uniref:Recombinase n=1 Tax=Trichococcus palustris TaxID=140314 RepID=A0A143YEV9_9LACT|nr:recombinase family protein [Trichococcus palustris]CZQ89070.1 recombinase [Trichococcus palustris]SFL00178.1 Site-specific DNA recombinase [Trichococcus palustris]
MESNHAIGYIRQSTSKQKSLEWQQDVIQQEAGKRNRQLVHVFHDKASGKNSERTGFSLMKASIATKKYTFLYVWRLDRISRNVSDLLEFHDYCSQYGVIIVSIADPITATGDSMARFQISVIGSVAQLQRELIAENQRIAFRRKHDLGLQLTARVPFGYRYISTDKIVIQEEEAETVRRVYALYLSGSGYKRICSILAAEGIKVRGNPFRVHNVRGILTNAFYSGYIDNEFGNVKGIHPPIVTRKLQNDVGKIQQSRYVKKKDFRRQLLTGKIKCPHCGKNLTIHIVGPSQKSRSYNKLYYYNCPLNSVNGKLACKGIHLRANEIEAQIVTAVIAFLNDKERLGQIQSQLNKKVVKKRDRTGERTESIESRKQAALVAFEKGVFSAKQLADELKRLNQYKAGGEAVQPKDELLDTVRLKELTERIVSLGAVQQMPTVQQYHFFQEVIDRIDIDSQKKVLGIYLKGYKKNILSEKKE